MNGNPLIAVDHQGVTFDCYLNFHQHTSKVQPQKLTILIFSMHEKSFYTTVKNGVFHYSLIEKFSLHLHNKKEYICSYVILQCNCSFTRFKTYVYQCTCVLMHICSEFEHICSNLVNKTPTLQYRKYDQIHFFLWRQLLPISRELCFIHRS